MKKEKVNSILEEVKKEWINRLKNGQYMNVPKNSIIDKPFLESLRKMLLLCPDEDGNKRITDATTGKTHLIPIKTIILDGIKQKDLYKYPEEIKC